jgi:hypothetical protein
METGIKHMVWLALALLMMGGFPSASLQESAVIADSNTPVPLNVIVKPHASFNNRIVIQPLTAVFYQPDSLQLIRLAQVMDAKAFKAMMHDYKYQFRYAKAFLEKEQNNVRIITTDKARFLEFCFNNHNTELIDLDKYESCGLFLFDGIQRPILADMTNIETIAGFYFSEKLNNK